MLANRCWVFEYNDKGWKRFDAYLTKRDASSAMRLFRKYNRKIETRLVEFAPAPKQRQASN